MLKTNEIIDFFKLENSHAKKELGQNFLINEKVANDIVNALDIKDSDSVLEIGPGLGALSEIIFKQTKNYVAVEYDQKFVNYLNKVFENSNVRIVKNNVLKFKEFTFNKIIGNLPYYLTSDIVEYVALNFTNIEKAVFMVQKECLKRFTAKSGKDYNSLNVLILYLYGVEELFKVTKENFFPVPNVESLVFSMTPRKNIDRDLAKKIYKVAKICFSNRRKTILNNLNTIAKNKSIISESLLECNLKDSTRAEELDINDFEKLTLTLINKNVIK